MMTSGAGDFSTLYSTRGAFQRRRVLVERFRLQNERKGKEIKQRQGQGGTGHPPPGDMQQTGTKCEEYSREREEAEARD
eukprot:scaffold164965_cov27-Tisochrysis_lutea.AAC.1